MDELPEKPPEAPLSQRASGIEADIRRTVRDAAKRATAAGPVLSPKDAAEITRQARLKRKPS